MIHIALYEPEIPPNTGNIMRLCANTGAQLHLIEPLGFDLDEKKLRRAGLDYRDSANVVRHASWEAFQLSVGERRLFALTTRGTTSYASTRFQQEDVLLFGAETRGLPEQVHETIRPGHSLRIPMQPDSRSLNLSNAAAVVLFEALRQLDFPGLTISS